MADLQARIERELIAAAGRSGRLRYARTPLPRPGARASQPAPAELSGSYSSLADGQVHEGPPVRGRQGHEKGRDATVTIHGTATGGCIEVLFAGDLGPGVSCFTAANAGRLWMATGGILLVLVPDAATDISVEDRDGSRRPPTATSNLVAAHPSDTVRYSVGTERTTVKARTSSR